MNLTIFAFHNTWPIPSPAPFFSNGLSYGAGGTLQVMLSRELGSNYVISH